ncbi:MAG: GTP-binding protein [Chitinophagia bacterium]|nr:GTP-binding protein [Chitinophagia bacterium]
MQSTKPLIPVTVLTGALGAGKTTLLNAVLRQVIAPNQRLAIIVNEFGAVGIDDVLVQSSSEEVVLLPGGCVCCAVRSDLVQAILQLERAVHRGEMPAFNRIVIETSGLAEPAPILQLFAESPALQGRFRLDAVVTVVDALLGEAALQSESTAWRQVLLADRLIINKCALQSAVALDALHARLSEINPQAECVRLMQPAHIQVNDFQQPDLPYLSECGCITLHFTRPYQAKPDRPAHFASKVDANSTTHVYRRSHPVHRSGRGCCAAGAY